MRFGRHPSVTAAARWYAGILFDADEAFEDKVYALPRLGIRDVRLWVACLLIDHAGLGRVVVPQPRYRTWHLGYVRDFRDRATEWLVDNTKLGKTLVAELMYRYHLQRARDSSADVYCVWHGCAAEKCPNDGAHDGD